MISVLKRNNLHRIPDKPELIDLYYNNKMTLADIGFLYGVSRERVRQWMEREELERRASGLHWKLKGSPRKNKLQFATLDDYFSYVKKTGKEHKPTLYKFFKGDGSYCESCKIETKLEIHHIRRPALSSIDIKVFCTSCHKIFHRNGMNKDEQLQLCNDYLKGLSPKQLNNKYHVRRPNIYYFLRKWGFRIQYRRPRLSKEQQQEICQEYMDGRSCRNISADRDRKKINLYYYLRKFGIIPNRIMQK